MPAASEICCDIDSTGEVLFFKDDTSSLASVSVLEDDTTRSAMAYSVLEDGTSSPVAVCALEDDTSSPVQPNKTEKLCDAAGLCPSCFLASLHKTHNQ